MAVKQPTLSESAGVEPTIGVTLDERTHYAHVRYAAVEQPGVIWFDPRDGHEYLTTGADTSLDALDDDDRVLTSVRIHAKHGRCQQADPDGEWVVRIAFAELDYFQPLKMDAEPEAHVVTGEETDVYEDVYAARQAAADRVDAYAEAEYRDAVAHRTGGDD